MTHSSYRRWRAALHDGAGGVSRRRNRRPGNPAAVRVMTDVVRVWGTISVVAIHAEPMPVNLYQMFARELTMHGSRLYAREDWEDAIGLAARGAVTLTPLVSRRVPLEGLQDGMEQALGGGLVMKVLVDLTAR